MRLASFLVWKNWRSSPLRVLLTWLGVALGVAVVVSIQVLDHNTILSKLERKRGDFGRVDLEMRPQDPKADLDKLRRRLEARPDLSRVGLIARAEVELRLPGKHPFQAALYGLAPPGGDVFGHYRVARGKDLTPLDPPDRVLVSPVLARSLGLEVGSTLVLSAMPWVRAAPCVHGKRVLSAGGKPAGPPPQRRVTVQGILEPFRIARRDQGLVLVGPFSLARALARPFMPLFQVDRAPGVDPDRLAASLEKDFLLEENRTALIGEGADERAFRNGVRVMGGLALVLGMFVIFHTLSHALAEKIRSLGILRSLGATPSQVVRAYLLDALLLAVLGSLTGVGLGILLARILGKLRITTLGLGKPLLTFEIPWSPLLAVAGLGVFFTLLGASFPLFKIRRLTVRKILYVRDLAPPADLMRGVHLFLFATLVLALPLAWLAMTPLLTGEGKGAGWVLLEAAFLVILSFSLFLLAPGLVRASSRPVLALLSPFLPLAAFMARKNLLRSPGRLATAVCGLTLVALAGVGIRSITGSLKGEIRDFAALGMKGRLFLRCAPVPEETWKKLHRVPGVASVLPLDARVGLPFLVVGTDPEELARPGGPLFGKPELLRAMKEERGLLVSGRLSNLKKIRPGWTLRAPTGAGTVTYKVLAVTDRAGFFPDERAFALADRKWLHWDFCVDVTRSGRFTIRLVPGTDPAAAAREIRKILEPETRVGWIRTGREVEEAHLADVDKDFLFFDILLALLLLLAGTGQVNLMTLTALARSREIGMLRALGMTRGEYAGILLVEAVLVGWMAALLTFLAGLPLSWVLVRGLRAVSGLPVPYRPPLEACLLAAGLAFLVSLLSALVPALRATGRPPAQAVRSTE